MRAFRIGMRPELGQLSGVGVVVEGAGDQHVEPRLGGLAGGGDEVGAGEGAELGTDQDAGAALRLALQEPAFGADVFAGPGEFRIGCSKKLTDVFRSAPCPNPICN